MSAEQELHELEAQLRSASGVPPREQLRQFLRLVRPWGRQGSRCMRSWQPQARPGDAAGRPRRPTLPRRPRRSVAHVRAAPARRLLRSAARRASTMQSSSRAMAPCCCSTTAVGCRRRSVSGSTGHTAPAAHAQTASPARSLLLLHASTQRCTCAAYLTSPNPSNSTSLQPPPLRSVAGARAGRRRGPRVRRAAAGGAADQGGDGALPRGQRARQAAAGAGPATCHQLATSH